MNNSLRDMILKHYGPLVVGLVVLVFVVMSAAAREYVNYQNIQINIDQQIDQQEYRSEKIAFEQNFLIPYLNSSSALFFYRHENSILGDDEYIIRVIPPETPTKENIITSSHIQKTQDAWRSFGANVIDYIQKH